MSEPVKHEGIINGKLPECWLCDTTAELHEEHNRAQAKKTGEYQVVSLHSNDPGYVNRLLIATPTLGQVRMEWVQSRYGQIVPTNWSMVQMVQFMNSYIVKQYQVDDAQNMIAKEVVEKGFEWLLLIEDDVVLPPDAFIRFNKYMRDGNIPVVSGLYYTKSIPPEPMIYRGRGTSYFTDWKRGDKVWVDGVPTGCLLIHSSIIKEMWNDAEEYQIGNVVTRRVFNNPRIAHFDEETGLFNTTTGTSDLDWCTRVMKGDYFTKAGWTKEAIGIDFPNKKYPFLIDTAIFCDQVDPQGRLFPSGINLNAVE